MCPLCVATDWGGYFFKECWFSPGRSVMYCLVSAFSSVLRDGEKRAAWEKATSSAAFVGIVTVLALWGFGRLRCQRLLLLGLRVPCSIVLLLYWMVTVEAVNVAVQPTSQSWPMETKEVSFSLGKRCTVRACLGRLGMGSTAVCVETMVLLSGRVTRRGCFALRTSSIYGEAMLKKWPVHPVSAMLIGGEGPSGVKELTDSLVSLFMLGCPLTYSSSSSARLALGCPRRRPPLLRFPWLGSFS